MISIYQQPTREFLFRVWDIETHVSVESDLSWPRTTVPKFQFTGSSRVKFQFTSLLSAMIPNFQFTCIFILNAKTNNNVISIYQYQLQIFNLPDKRRISIYQFAINTKISIYHDKWDFYLLACSGNFNLPRSVRFQFTSRQWHFNLPTSDISIYQ